MQIYDNSTYISEYIYLGIVEEVSGEGLARIEQKNKFGVGEDIEIMKPDGKNVPVRVLSLTTGEGEAVLSAPHAKEILWVGLSRRPEQYDILRVRKNSE